MNKDLEWFCFHVVTEGLLSQEDCRAVASAMAEADIEADVMTFAQAIIDNSLCADVDRLQQLLEMAIQEARTLGFPPRSVFDDDAAAP
ncbi:MAG: hypothetical protein GX595_01825, partial [Lentisphaerae bacterium]|nr:hypothetical protein [Lentisphaerota bacterium]